ncbi:MAG: hypothetical protein ACPG4U_10730, partial [Pseudomonadales bacterium]
MQGFAAATLLAMGVASQSVGAACYDSADTFSAYDAVVKHSAINALPSRHYLLSYSWTPGYCAGVSDASVQPG